MPSSLECLKLVLLSRLKFGHFLARVDHAHLATHLLGGAKQAAFHDAAVGTLDPLQKCVYRVHDADMMEVRKI